MNTASPHRPSRPFVRLSQPVLWHLLISEADRFSERTGWGLAGVWHHIHAERYAEARAALDRVIATHEAVSERQRS